MDTLICIVFIAFSFLVIADPMCLDLNGHCNYWASIGECDRDPDYYMHVNCPWSCGKCADLRCQDHNTNCNYWASFGDCKRKTDFMDRNCPWSCGKCVDGPDAGNVEIENCNAGVIDIRENAINTIKCAGFNVRSFIVWTFKRDDEEIPRTVATCYPSSNCTVHQPDHFAVERSESESTLFYQQYDREVDKAAIVACLSKFGVSQRSTPCNVNVINPAELSNCTVEEDRNSGTVSGRCHFEHAYSDSRAFECTWYQQKDGQSKRFSGNIKYDNGSLGPSGWCTFTTTLESGTYTYSILFYPGTGNITVNVGNIETKTPEPTRRTTQATRSPDLSSPTNNFDYTSPRTQEENDLPRTQEDNDLPMGALVGGIVAGVAVIIIVVVVVVVCVRRKRKQKPAGSALGSSNDNATENDDFEEHVSPMYSTSDGPDASQDIDENTYEVPAHRPPDAEPEHVYNDSNTATTTTTTTPSHSITTTTGDLHNITTNQHRGQGNNLDNVHHNPVYVNENQPGEESSSVQQHPTYVNDYPETAPGYVGAHRDSNPYYSEIKDTGIN